MGIDPDPGGTQVSRATRALPAERAGLPGGRKRPSRGKSQPYNWGSAELGPNVPAGPCIFRPVTPQIVPGPSSAPRDP